MVFDPFLPRDLELNTAQCAHCSVHPVSLYACQRAPVSLRRAEMQRSRRGACSHSPCYKGTMPVQAQNIILGRRRICNALLEPKRATAPTSLREQQRGRVSSTRPRVAHARTRQSSFDPCRLRGLTRVKRGERATGTGRWSTRPLKFPARYIVTPIRARALVRSASRMQAPLDARGANRKWAHYFKRAPAARAVD